jgi:hypothetical protein
MYELLKKITKEEKEKELQNQINYIKENNENVINYYLTELRIKQLQNGEITKEKAQELAIKKAIKENKKQLENKLKHIEKVENEAREIKSISVVVEWVVSRTWGHNPNVIAFTQNKGCTYGSASGCGYDKESSAIAEAFNKNENLLKILYDIKEKALKDDITVSSHDSIGYGAGYGAIPYFEGGVGVSCFWHILEKAGYKTKSISGRNWTSYIIEKEA